MSPNAVIALLERTGALLSGHFLLSSGLHSDRYCQCAKLFEDPGAGAQTAELMRAKLPAGFAVDTVLAPALGGILWGYDLARALGARSLFAERPTGGAFALRRGFELRAGERVLLAEDVITTGKSILELVPLVEGAGALVAGFCAVADRSKGAFAAKAGAPFFSLVELSFETWPPEGCPLCAKGSAAVKPGSRA